MLIVMDYDETFTEDKTFWSTFILDSVKLGHTVVCCTMRFGDVNYDSDVIGDMEKLNIPIVFAGMHPDKFTALGRSGYDADKAIWIDDSPQYIVI